MAKYTKVKKPKKTTVKIKKGNKTMTYVKKKK